MTTSSFDEFPIELITYVAVAFSAVVAIVYLIAESFLPSLLQFLSFGFFRQPPPPPLPPATADEIRALQEAAQLRRARRVEQQNDDAECVICLGALERPVELLPCAHFFCQDCFCALVDTPAFQNRCPTCRQNIHFVAPAFQRMPPNETAEQTMANFADSLRRFNQDRRYLNNNNNNFLNHHNNQFLGTFNMVIQFAMRNFGRLPVRAKLQIFFSVLFALTYLVSPYDLLSEAVAGPVVGFLDDLVVIIIASIIVYVIIKRTFLQ